MFFLSHMTPVKRSDALWCAPMPLNREAICDHLKNNKEISISYGDYFSAACDFLKRNEFEILKIAVSQQANRRIEKEEIKEVQIHLEKHGEFYHPSRIAIVLEGLKISFVLNIGISDAGQNLIKREFKILDKLNSNFSCSYLPRVYALDEAYTQNDFKIQMFLGEWFEGFNEFHLSFDKANGKNGIRVWDPVQGPFFITSDQTLQLYREVAKIHTCYYDLETFEQIFPWHHAAGDFVLNHSNEQIELRLVTVRGYTASMDEKDMNPGSILEALLVFLLHLSIRMRLDRLDGVGDIVWSDNVAVEETLNGFFQGLALKLPISIFSDPLEDCFMGYISSWTEKELYDLSEAIVNLYHPKSPDVPVIKENLKAHMESLYKAINN